MNSTLGKPYHHGDLRSSLVAAAEEIIRDEGIEGFSLRKATRMAGVSPGAANHHFDGVSALMTEVAIRAYQALGAALSTITRSSDPAAHLQAQASGYVKFAADNPGKFRLMSRIDLVDATDARIRMAAYEALRGMLEAAADYCHVPHPQPEAGHIFPGIVGIIATAHGLAHLTLEGRWFRMLDVNNSDVDLKERLLPSVLSASWPRR